MNNRELGDHQKKVRREYWKELCRESDDPDKRWAYFFEHVLPQDLAHAWEKQRLPSDHRQVLILLVGHALEPLLQSICVWKPERVVLILNRSYGRVAGRSLTAETYGQEIQGRIAQLPGLAQRLGFASDDPRSNLIGGWQCEPQVERVVLLEPSADGSEHGDAPHAVFRRLRKEVLPRLRGIRRDQVLVDITGGKKSMVAGAYLFAAYAGIDVSYVDFDDDAYDAQYGRPYGDACRISTLANPYEKFGLREWERVRELIDKYAFRSASQVVRALVQTMPGYFADQEIAAARRLADVLEVLELWDNGDFRRSYLKFDRLQAAEGRLRSLLPDAISTLGQRPDFWPGVPDPDDVPGGPVKIAEHLLQMLEGLEFGRADETSGGACQRLPLYLDLEPLLVYAWDELAKIRRLIEKNEDCRSALLRAVGLWEVLLRARLLVLIESGHFELADLGEPVGGDRSVPTAEFRSWTDCSPDVNAWKSDLQRTLIESFKPFDIVAALRFATNDAEKHKKSYMQVDCAKANGAKRRFRLRRSEALPQTRLRKELILNVEKRLRDKSIHTYLSVPPTVAKHTWDIVRCGLQDFAGNWASLLLPADRLGANACLTEVAAEDLFAALGIDFVPRLQETL